MSTVTCKIWFKICTLPQINSKSRLSRWLESAETTKPMANLRTSSSQLPNLAKITLLSKTKRKFSNLRCNISNLKSISSQNSKSFTGYHQKELLSFLVMLIRKEDRTRVVAKAWLGTTKTHSARQLNKIKQLQLFIWEKDRQAPSKRCIWTQNPKIWINHARLLCPPTTSSSSSMGRTSKWVHTVWTISTVAKIRLINLSPLPKESRCPLNNLIQPMLRGKRPRLVVQILELTPQNRDREYTMQRISTRDLQRTLKF